MTRLFVIIALLALAVSLFISVKFFNDAYKVIPINPATEAETVGEYQDWFPYESSVGGFKVMLPLLPQEASQTVIDPKTQQENHYQMYVAQENNGTIFMINVITYPSAPDAGGKLILLKGLMNGMVAADKKNELIEMTTTDYQGMPALHFSIENEERTIYAKEFMKGNTIYLLFVIAKPDQLQDAKAKFAYFVKSFNLLEGAIPSATSSKLAEQPAATPLKTAPN